MIDAAGGRLEVDQDAKATRGEALKAMGALLASLSRVTPADENILDPLDHFKNR